MSLTIRVAKHFLTAFLKRYGMVNTITGNRTQGIMVFNTNHCEVKMTAATSNWIPIMPYHRNEHDRKRGIKTHEEYSLVSDTERVIRRKTAVGYEYRCQFLLPDGWIGLHAINQHVTDEQSAFEMARWRAER